MNREISSVSNDIQPHSLVLCYPVVTMSFRTLQQIFFFTLLVVVTVAFVWLIQSFLFPIFWAIVLAVLFFPLYRRWLEWTNQRASVSAILTIFSILLVVLVPLAFLGNSLVRQSITFYEQINHNEGTLRQSIDTVTELSLVERLLDSTNFDQARLEKELSGRLQSLSQAVFTRVVDIGQNTVQFIFYVFITFYILYYFFKHGPQLAGRIMRYLPIGDQKEARLFRRFVSTTRATIKGSIVVGIVQGLIGGLLFFFVGLDAPLLWGAVMAVASIVPVVGSAIVWVPAGALLVLTDHGAAGIVVFLVGALVISTIDNVIRPPLVGKDTRMPDVLILLSTLGGIGVFGISGIIIGPIITAFFLAIWEMFEKDYRQELAEKG